MNDPIFVRLIEALLGGKYRTVGCDAPDEDDPLMQFYSANGDEEWWELPSENIKVLYEVCDISSEECAYGYLVLFLFGGTLYVGEQNASPFSFYKLAA